MELFFACFAVFAKEVRHLWRARARVAATFAFAVATLLIFSFAGGLDGEVLRANAAGYFWAGLLLASTLCLSESFRVENEHGALEALLLLPVHPTAIFVGKAAGNAVVLMVVGVAVLPIATALFDLHFAEGIPAFLLTIFAGCLAIAAPGTVHAALASRARSSDVLLPLLLFPLVVPCVIASVQASRLALAGDAMNQYPSWLSVVAAFALVQWLLGAVLFAQVVED